MSNGDFFAGYGAGQAQGHADAGYANGRDDGFIGRSWPIQRHAGSFYYAPRASSNGTQHAEKSADGRA